MLSNTLVDSIKAIPFGSRNFIVQCADRVTNPPNSLLRDIALKRTVGSSHCSFISGLSKGHKIVYWTARGGRSGKDYTLLTKEQLAAWDCKYHNLIMNDKPSYDLIICDKTKRIEEV